MIVCPSREKRAACRLPSRWVTTVYRTSGLSCLVTKNAPPTTSAIIASVAIVQDRIFGAVFDGGAVPCAISREAPSAVHFSSSLSSDLVWKRSSGFLARHVLTTCSKAGGVSGWVAEIGSRSFSRIALATLIWLLPANARLPVAISYRTAPSANRSDRASAFLPSICSGDMYWIVPITSPTPVRGDIGLGPLVVLAADNSGAFDAPAKPAAVALARPKSINLAPDLVSMMLPGFRSR